MQMLVSHKPWCIRCPIPYDLPQAEENIDTVCQMLPPFTPKILLIIQSPGPVFFSDWYFAVRIVVVVPLFGVEKLFVRIVRATWRIPRPGQLIESTSKRQCFGRGVSTQMRRVVVLEMKSVEPEDHKRGSPTEYYEEIQDNVSECKRAPATLLGHLHLPFILVVWTTRLVDEATRSHPLVRPIPPRKFLRHSWVDEMKIVYIVQWIEGS